MLMKNRFLISISILILLYSCKKDSFITSADAEVSISADEIKFDTVFTTAGSITQSFKIINEDEAKKGHLGKIKARLTFDLPDKNIIKAYLKALKELNENH